MNYFGKLSDYYKNQGGIQEIFDFLILQFNDKKFTIKRSKNEIIIILKYTFGSKEDEISFEINKKEIGLKKKLTNIDESLKEINKNLFEKVYPIGSYYWSEKDISPERLFGGKWEKIEGRFLFASDSNHHVGETGGEERHQLTIDEMPSHSHGYDKFHNDDWYYTGSGSYRCPTEKVNNFLRYATTNSCGGSQSHNNMPPFLTANCWKRTG